MVKYDVVLLPFFFEDDFNKYKIRPAVILDDKTVYFIGSKITSHNPRTKCDYQIQDLDSAGLTKESCIRLDKVNNFKADAVLKVLGHLSDEDIKGIEAILNNMNEAIEKHDKLNQKIFNGEELDQKVKDKLLEIVDKFKESLEADEVKLDIKDVVIVGSSVSYNYTKDSDIDLHIIADLSAYPNQEELAAKLYNAYKSLFNNKYDPTIYGIDVEIYVEPEGMKANSKGRYSLLNGWVDKPEKEDVPEVPDIKDEYKKWEAKAKACDTAEEIDNFMDDVYKLRQSGLLAEGEFSKANLIFKELRNNNVLQDLKDKKVELENKDMSLEEAKCKWNDTNLGSDDPRSIIRRNKDNHYEILTAHKWDDGHYIHTAGNAYDSLDDLYAKNSYAKDFEVLEPVFDDDIDESWESRVAYDEIHSDFDDLELEEFSADDDFIIMYVRDTNTDEIYKAVVRDPDYSDEDSLSYQIFNAINIAIDHEDYDESLNEACDYADISIGDRIYMRYYGLPCTFELVDIIKEDFKEVEHYIYKFKPVDENAWQSVTRKSEDSDDKYDGYCYIPVSDMYYNPYYNITKDEVQLGDFEDGHGVLQGILDHLKNKEEISEEDANINALAEHLGISPEAICCEDDVYSTPEGDYLFGDGDIKLGDKLAHKVG